MCTAVYVWQGEALFRKYHGLQTGDLKTLAAANVLAAHHVIFSQHVGFCFGKSGAVALIGVTRKLLFPGAHDPGNFIIPGLVAVWTVQSGLLLLRTFIKKFALFHCSSLLQYFI